jgi:hypothetical protein
VIGGVAVGRFSKEVARGWRLSGDLGMAWGFHSGFGGSGGRSATGGSQPAALHPPILPLGETVTK